MVDAAERTPRQTLSKRAFNSDHRLTVVKAILRREGDLFDKQHVIDETSAPPTSVYRELMDLFALGLLSRTRDGNRVWFSTIDSPFWEWCAELTSGLETDDSVRSRSTQ